MRDYGRVHSTFWSSGTIASLSDDGRMLALYLMTCPHATIAGVFRLPDGYACEDLKWAPERVCKGFVELFDNGFANRCETTKWVWVRKHLVWNPPENPNQRKAIAKIADMIPDECGWKPDFMRASGGSVDPVPDKNGNGLETLSKPFANQEQEQEQEQKKARAAPTKKPSAPPDDDSPTVVNIPLNAGDDYPITADQVREFSGLYPAVDVAQALRGMRAWCVSNPAKRKTRGGVMRFVNAWLAKEQDRGPSRNAGTIDAAQASPAAMRRLA